MKRLSKKKIIGITAGIAVLVILLMLGVSACSSPAGSKPENGTESSVPSCVSEVESSKSENSKAESSKGEKPAVKPTAKPTNTPKRDDGDKAASSSGTEPAVKPTVTPKATEKPSNNKGHPTSRPIAKPTKKPMETPIAKPTTKPTAEPTTEPTLLPTATPEPEKVWIVDVPAQEEQGHWEEVGHFESDWVYRCNQCGHITSTEEEMWNHEGDLSACWSYTKISGEQYWVKDGENWIVDVPAREEQGHWEYK